MKVHQIIAGISAVVSTLALGMALLFVAFGERSNAMQMLLVGIAFACLSLIRGAAARIDR